MNYAAYKDTSRGPMYLKEVEIGNGGELSWIFTNKRDQAVIFSMQLWKAIFDNLGNPFNVYLQPEHIWKQKINSDTDSTRASATLSKLKAEK